MTGRTGSRGSGAESAVRQRPDHFSTYVSRDLVRRLKVIATLRDVPLWALVTLALEDFLGRFEEQHGRLPELSGRSGRERGE
jgi:hypothetical protein